LQAPVLIEADSVPVTGRRGMGEGSRDHVIVVSGKAERKVQPDRAHWVISVDADAQSEQEAFNECSRRASDLMERLRGVAGDDGEVATAYVRVAPRWEADRKRYVGYEASTTVTASTEIELAGKVAQAAMSDAVGHISGPEFDLSGAEAIKDELLASAVGVAQGKAERLAKAAGRELGRVVSIRERGIEEGPGRGVYLTAMSLDESRAVEPEIAAADQTIAAEVIVGFEFAD
jgi:uncharacterized protein YggE